MDFSEQLPKDFEKIHKDRNIAKKFKTWRKSGKQWRHLFGLLLFSQKICPRIVLNAGIAHYAQNGKNYKRDKTFLITALKVWSLVAGDHEQDLN